MTESKNLSEFLGHLKKVEPEIMRIHGLLLKDIHEENLESIRQYTEEILASRAYLVVELARFNRLLDDATAELLPPKTKELSELDRKTMVDARVSIIRQWRDITKGLVETIDRRVSYAQSELSFEKEYAKQIHNVGA